MQQPEPPTFREAEGIVRDPQATPEQLSLIARDYPALRALVAAHPHTYPGLLDWLDQCGDDATKQAVAARRAAVQPPPPGTAPSYPPALAPSMPSTAPAATSKTATALLITGIAAIGIIALAVVAMTTPALTWLGLRSQTSPTTSVGWNDPAGADYANGAVPQWTFDLAQQYPGESLNFTFGPILDDAWHWSRYNPLEIGQIWIAPFTSQDDAGARDKGGLLGLDRTNGKVLWRADEVNHCATMAIKDELPCLSATPESPRVVMVNVTTGAVRSLGFDSTVDYLAVAGEDLVVASESDSGVTLSAVKTDGSVRWRQTLTAYEGGIAQDPTVVGDYLMVVSLSGFTVVRTSDGAIALDSAESPGILLAGGRLVVENTFPVNSAQAGLTITRVAGYPRLLTDTGQPVLFVGATSEGTPDQWCPNLDPAQCRDIPNSASVDVEAVITDDSPQFFMNSDYGELGSFDLESGAQLAEYSNSDSLYMGAYLNHGRIRIQNTYESPRIDMYNTRTGASIGSISAPDWYPLSRLTGGRLILTHTADEYGFVPTRITMYAPAPTPGTGLKEPTVTATTQPTSGLPSCPSGSVQLAYATFPDGWVLVCGVDAGTPTQWYSSDSSGELSSTSVSFDATNYRYTASFPDGTSGWLNHTPGVFGHASGTGEILAQRSVGQIWFVALDSGNAPSATPSTGPFGVPLPQDTAEDQVRYLSALLQKSASARKTLQPAVIAVRDCQNGTNGDYSAAVATISSVTDNRRELLSALETAPVDKVPQGTTLVSELRSALTYSLRADEAYLAWATAVNSSGCGSGSEAAGTKNSKRAGAAKEIFVKRWNSQIASQFNAPRFTREKL